MNTVIHILVAIFMLLAVFAPEFLVESFLSACDYWLAMLVEAL